MRAALRAGRFSGAFDLAAAFFGLAEEAFAAATLAFSARVGDRELDGIDLLRFDPDGRVRELVVYVRPMSGVNALAEAMKAKLEEAAT